MSTLHIFAAASLLLACSGIAAGLENLAVLRVDREVSWRS